MADEEEDDAIDAITNEEPQVRPEFPGPHDPKAEFLRCFNHKRTIAGAVRMSGTDRDTFNEWMRTDSDFNRKFTQAEEVIDDAALEIAYRETGLLPKTGGHRKLKLDRALLREILKRHPRFKPAEEKKATTEARPIEIRGIDPKILLRVTGSGMEIGINPEPPLNVVDEPKALPEIMADAAPKPPEVKISQPFVPSFTPEEINEMKARKSARAKAIREKYGRSQQPPAGNA